MHVSKYLNTKNMSVLLRACF